MEKAILKTLIYADIFDYPMKTWEIHKWLIEKKANLQQVEKALERLSQKLRVGSLGGYYFLLKRKGLVGKRLRKAVQSDIYLKQARAVAQLCKLIPWVKLVGISGNLAMENAGKVDDIDLFVVTGQDRLWISRLLLLGILSLIGKRRKRNDSLKKSAGKICVNLLLEEDRLGQQNKDIYLAHEVLQMKVLWQRDGIYSKYLSDNQWAFEFLPNWVVNSRNELKGRHKNHNSLINYLDQLAMKIQLKIMQKPQGLEHIQDGALYFHPQDCRQTILKEYAKKIAKF